MCDILFHFGRFILKHLKYDIATLRNFFSLKIGWYTKESI